jgi:hypothetical protein
MIGVFERKARDEDAVRWTDGSLDRHPQLVVFRRTSVLIFEREPDRSGAEDRTCAAVLLAPCSSRFPREPEAKAAIPWARRPGRIWVTGKDGDERNFGVGSNTCADGSCERVDAVVEMGRKDGNAAAQCHVRALPQYHAVTYLSLDGVGARAGEQAIGEQPHVARRQGNDQQLEHGRCT